MSERKPLQRTIRGGRAFFFQDPATDKVLNMVVTLAGEVWTLRERLAAMEAIAIRQGSLSPAEVDDFEFTAEQEARLAGDRKEFIENLFRILQEQTVSAASSSKPNVVSRKATARRKPALAKPKRAASGRRSKK